MDDLAHELPLNHRKRKARQDDHDDDKPQSTRPTRENDAAVRPAKAPRLSWLSPDASPALWNSPASPQVSTPITSPSALAAAFPLKSSQGVRESILHEQPSSPSSPTSILSDPVNDRTDSEGEDMNPEPVLCQSPQLPFDTPDVAPSISPTTLDIAGLHFPPLIPLINRQTLKDLDFNEIMHNTPLRHDILFDSGLQFRPTGHRRKKDYIERYWDAVCREIESGCTCFSYSASNRKFLPTICVCEHVSPPPDTPLAFFVSPSIITIRAPPRVRPLLAEFLQVLLHVIQPLSMLSGPYVNPEFLHAPIREHTEQAVHIRSLFDPALIEQELKHGVFDPSGLFQIIGATLKAHCAPMRDLAIDSMVEAAKACAPGCNANTRDAVKVMRNCLEILELMKLDIANHQMQTLRPFLVYSSGSFERKMLRSRRSIDPSLPVTKEWLRLAHNSFVSQTEPIKLPSQPQGLRYASLGRKQQLYISVVRSLVDTVFSPPSSTSPASASTNTRPSSVLDHPFPSFPETLYLDQARIQNHSSEITDTIALWMFLLLYRQLASCSSQGKYQKERIDEYAAILKREIRAIGPRSLGTCFLKDTDTSSDICALPGSNQTKMTDKLRDMVDDVVLQVARRATSAQRNRKPTETTSPSSADADVPGESTVSVARKWTFTNMKTDSSLRKLLHGRLKKVVFEKVLADVYPAHADSALEKMMGQEIEGYGEVSVSSRGCQGLALPRSPLPLFGTKKPTQVQSWGNGLEMLGDEVQSLVDKISLLVVVHFNAYLPVYEKEEFMQAVL